MKRIQLLLAAIVASVGVAVTYHFFEAAVRNSTNYVWNTLFKTGTDRLMVIPLCLVLTLVFFAAQHWLDRKSETHESKGLGNMPDPTVVNFIKILIIGFFSLLAGATLGPEAILVPSCMLLGAFIGVKLFSKDKQAPKALAMVGFIALFAAFFNSFWAGMIGLLLIKKQTKMELKPPVIILAAIASVTTVLTLTLFTAEPFMPLPAYVPGHRWADLIAIGLLLVGGFLLTYAIAAMHAGFEHLRKLITTQSWWFKALVAGLGLSALYLAGGPLVEFTGNQSVAPMLQQSAGLGVLGLVWIAVVKVSAIGWSKAMGYRGGLIFPTMFVASVLVAIAELTVKDVNFTYGFIAVVIGVLAANNKSKTLF